MKRDVEELLLRLRIYTLAALEGPRTCPALQEMVEAFQSLDATLSAGCPLPADWQGRRGK